ncbi:protein kinase [Streptomyces sp. CA-111067]|uniref:protein kinase n=1 Tax=Streptomyces sp. CA-111067 TaxID=3240046 RepID=UPI003D991C53
MSGSLPGQGFRDLIRPHAGEIVSVERTKRGFSAEFTGLIDAEHGRFFVKAVRNRPGGHRASLYREWVINPAVQPLSPAIRWTARDDEWIVLGFEAVEARHARFEPGSPDLPRITGALKEIAHVTVPDEARGWAETRWDRFAGGEAEAGLFRGDTLLHTDINPSNILVGARAVWLVDWAWPTLGAAFIDPAILALQLVAAGHSAESAESWAAHCPGWTDADPRAIDAFAVAQLRMYQGLVERRPDQEWLGAMVTAAREWLAHRSVPLAPGGSVIRGRTTW